ncbi:MAG: sugar phosphate nucleotidyltransferase, partial [Firmicutes bacterium]|nr:sugar phosphate nucleotidyltransferase [Bacillota bacterium]
PVPLIFTKDLHSMGQYVQAGKRILFETFLNTNDDNFLNRAAKIATIKAHAEANVPVALLNLPTLDTYGLGYLFYFLQISCAMSAMLFGINPFGQPGVDGYKNHMEDEIKNPTLVILAAGMGSRYGGVKQIESVGGHDELIIDYSIFDAKKAGFKKVVFVIRRDIEEDFKNKIFNRIKNHIDAEYVFQDLPTHRTKPYGTAHALLAAQYAVNSPFCVINADDFYGFDAYKKMAKYLSQLDFNDEGKCAIVGYKLKNTVSKHGIVSRGIVCLNQDNKIQTIKECKIKQESEDKIGYIQDDKFFQLPTDTIASMGFFGFSPDVFLQIKNQFEAFLSKNKDSLSAESILAEELGTLIKNNSLFTQLFESKDDWYGFTYAEDKQAIKDKIADMIQKGVYPSPLWDTGKTQ